MLNRSKNRKESFVIAKTDFILLCLAVFSLCSPVFGAKIETKSYPLYLSLDNKYEMATSLYLKCDVIDYSGLPYGDFVSKEKGERENMFKQIVSALRKNDFDEILYLSHKKKSMTDEEIEEHVKKVERKISNCRLLTNDEIMGANLEKLKIFHQIYLGDSSYIVFGADDMKTNAPYRLMLKFKPDSSKKISWDVEKVNEIRLVIQDMINQMARFPEEFNRKIGRPDKKYDFEIPFPGAEGSHETLLQFDGKRYNVNVCKDTVDPNDEVASLFQQQFFVIKNQSREALAELYGGRSREAYLEWIQKADEASLKSGANYLDWHFKEMATVDRILRFILDADPLYIIFYQKEGNEKLLNQFIVRDPQNGQLKFRNLYVLDFFKQWLDSPSVQSALCDLILENKD